MLRGTRLLFSRAEEGPPEVRLPRDSPLYIVDIANDLAEGETDSAQLYPFDGTDSIVLEPVNGNGQFCLEAGNERLDSAACTGDQSQAFELV